MNSHFVVIWCNEGLEGVIPVTDIERNVMFQILKGETAESPVSQHINMAILRARFNTQRAYEIYSVEAVPGITTEDVKELFASPQYGADTIRRLGYKIYSDRVDPAKYTIT